MRIIGIIPARMASTRFPGKPLANILGRPMIYHVYFRSQLCKRLDGLYIATPDKEIKDYCAKNGIGVILTRDIHERASDRVAEATRKIERKTKKRSDIVVMIQGDEPMVIPQMIDMAIEPILKDKNILVVNLMAPLKAIQEHDSPNEVKVVVDKEGFAMYFSREPIPSRKKTNTQMPMMKQVCIIPFRRDFLLRFSELEPTPLEIRESIDMLRAMEHGYKVKMVLSDYVTYSVDTQNDLDRVSAAMKDDPLMKLYK